MPRSPFRWLALALLIASCSSCGLFPPGPPPKAKQVMYDWRDDHGPGEVSVEIDLASQVATYHRGGRLIGWSYVSSGKEGHATKPGDYRVMEKLDVKYSDRYGWIADASGQVTNGDARPTTPVPPGNTYFPAPMHSWMRLTSYGIGMHAGEIPKPGEAASHGCIRLPRDFVPKLYEVVKVGTPVKVTRGRKREEPPVERLGDARLELGDTRFEDARLKT